MCACVVLQHFSKLVVVVDGGQAGGGRVRRHAKLTELVVVIRRRRLSGRERSARVSTGRSRGQAKRREVILFLIGCTWSHSSQGQGASGSGARAGGPPAAVPGFAKSSSHGSSDIAMLSGGSPAAGRRSGVAPGLRIYPHSVLANGSLDRPAERRCAPRTGNRRWSRNVGGTFCGRPPGR